jgi:transcriptional repressor NrdR
MDCGKRFTTYEHVELDDLVVVKKDGRRASFDRQKIVNGLLKACEKRPVSRDQVEATVDEIERKLRSEQLTEVSSARIGELVMDKLRELDKVAFIRFASVYQDFKSARDFEEQARVVLQQEMIQPKTP